MNRNKPTIIFVLPRSPWPPYAGQARLSFFRAKELKKLGFKVILIFFTSSSSLSSEANIKLRKVFSEIHFIKIKKIDFCFIAIKAIYLRIKFNLPLQSSWLNSKSLINKFKKKITFLEKKYPYSFFHLYSIRSYTLWSVIEDSKKRFVIDLVDSMTLNLERKCFILDNLSKYFWEFELNASRFLEQNLPKFLYCKKYLVVSKLDKKYLKIASNKKENSIFVSSVGYEIPQKIKPSQKHKNKSVIFFGSLSYEPNLSAIYWLLENVMPYVWENDNKITLKIAGRNPTKKLISICKKHRNISLIQNPTSMSRYIRSSTIALAPLISGSGQQFKIIEAIANGVPVLSTTMGAKPFGLIHNKDLIVEDEPKRFAKALLDLSNDLQKREYLRLNAYLKIKKKYSWNNLVQKLKMSIYI